MDAALAAIIGGVSGAAIGGIGSYAVAARASRDETKRMQTTLEAERQRLDAQRSFDLDLDYRADLRDAIDGCISAAVELTERYVAIHTLMDMRSKGLIDENADVVPEAIPGHIHPGDVISSFLDAWTEWKGARSKLWSRLPESSPMKSGTARFDLALHRFHQGTPGVRYSDEFGSDAAGAVARELNDAVSQMESAAFLIVTPERQG